MKDLKTKYIRAIILKDEITSYHNELIAEEDWDKKVRLFKNCFVCLDILRESFNNFNVLQKDDKTLSTKSRDLKKRLRFINHLRNKISGHIDETVLDKLVQWEPFIFNQGFKGNIEAQLLLTYKSLLESAINSYLDENSNQKIFKTEIDLVYPEDQTLFFNFVGKLNYDSVEFLADIITKLDKLINYWDESQLGNMATKAGKTNFKITNANIK